MGGCWCPLPDQTPDSSSRGLRCRPATYRWVYRLATALAPRRRAAPVRPLPVDSAGRCCVGVITLATASAAPAVTASARGASTLIGWRTRIPHTDCLRIPDPACRTPITAIEATGRRVGPGPASRTSPSREAGPVRANRFRRRGLRGHRYSAPVPVGGSQGQPGPGATQRGTRQRDSRPARVSVRTTRPCFIAAANYAAKI